MSEREHFTLKDEHVVLARHMVVRWDDTEFGAPCIDPKRPYGNSDVAADVGRVLGFEVTDEEGDLLTDPFNLACRLHDEMETALQVILASGSFTPGEYVADAYRRNWRLEPESAAPRGPTGSFPDNEAAPSGVQEAGEHG